MNVNPHAQRLRRNTTATVCAIVFCCLLATRQRAFAHDRIEHAPPRAKVGALADRELSDDARSESLAAMALFRNLIARWPNPLQESLIQQAWHEQQFVQRSDEALPREELLACRTQLLSSLQTRLPSIHVEWSESGPTLREPEHPLAVCQTIPSPLLMTVRNSTAHDVSLRAGLGGQSTPSITTSERFTSIRAKSSRTLLANVLFPAASDISLLPLMFADQNEPDRESTVDIPISLQRPATIRGVVREKDAIVPARVTVLGSDGVYRHGGTFASRASLTEKPIIYPPLGGWQKTSYFYTDGTFETAVPPGPVEVTVRRGFEHAEQSVHVDLEPGQVAPFDLACERIADPSKDGWVSGDTHVHWVTNQWNVNEPLDLLAMAQRAEGLRVANNLTLLQRYADSEFIKPSQAGMGPIQRLSDQSYHVQMGEEYRNENLYGHLCFLNIDDLVQPIGTGSIIAGPKAHDYPLNRTAIEDCVEQGGVSIEAHGTGGNKNVPINVIHNLTDSLDQLEPEMYYRLLDCGFRLPLTNGSDFPARTLGIARAYVRVDGSFSYANWIEGIRRGRTFTTSGPLIELSVNDANIGDVLDVAAGSKLQVKVRVVSRDPLGTVQVVSNGDVIAEQETDQERVEFDCSVTADQSRWIVARCSNRADGRADWGFGNFNAITGPGIAHTSPVYVRVSGRPRFDSAAAAYWHDRMRLHVTEVHTKGRFADDKQRQEAVDYLQDGITMYAVLEDQVNSARSRHETFEQAKSRLTNVVRRFRSSERTEQVLKQLKTSTTRGELLTALKPLTFVHVSINPESRVKVNATTPRLQLHEERPERFFVLVDNMAGTTAPLNLACIDLATDPPATAQWCTADIVDSPFTSQFLTGARSEFKVVEITPRLAGQREVRLTGDVGQGTQDLGFRATADVLLTIEPKTPRSAEKKALR